MLYVCINCRNTWAVGEVTEYPNISGGLCEQCTIEYVRARQHRQGYHDCFKRATEVCDQTGCSYWTLCAYPLMC